MRITDLLSLLGIGSLATTVFYVIGMKIFPALLIGFIIFVLGLSILNYLNHGKFTPFIRLITL